MKIAFFADCYYPNINGVTTSIAECKKELENLGHQVLVYTPKVPGYQDQDPGIFRPYSLAFPFQSEYRFALPFPLKLWKQALEQKPDLVHIHSVFNLGWMGIMLAKKLKIPVVFTHHTFWEDYCHYFPLLPEKWGKKLARWLEKTTADASNLVIAPSNEAKNRLKEIRSKTPVEVLPTGIELELFAPGGEPQVLTGDGVCRLLYVGRLGKEKNLPLLLHSLKLLRQQGLPVKLRLVGDGPERASLEKLAKELDLTDSAEFLGYQPRAELHNFYREADLFVFPSESETQGLVLVEAAASGLAVVAVACEVTQELYEQKIIAGLSPGEPGAFAKKIAELWGNPEELLRSQTAAYAGAEFFSRENLTAKLLGFYQKTLQNEGKPGTPA